jgi:hypothetical protein
MCSIRYVTGSPGSNARTGSVARLRAGTEFDVNLAARKPGLLECKGDRRTKEKEIK